MSGMLNQGFLALQIVKPLQQMGKSDFGWMCYVGRSSILNTSYSLWMFLHLHLKLSPTAWSSCLKCHSNGSLVAIITCARVWKCSITYFKTNESNRLSFTDCAHVKFVWIFLWQISAFIQTYYKSFGMFCDWYTHLHQRNFFLNQVRNTDDLSCRPTVSTG